jgi:hypothetical protein
MGAQDILEPISKYAQRQRQEPSTSRTPPGKASPIFVPEPQQPEPCVAQQAQAGVLIRDMIYLTVGDLDIPAQIPVKFRTI